MSCWVNIINRIVAAVSIQVKSVYTFGIKIVCAIGRNEPAPLGVVVACVEKVKPCFTVDIVAAVAYWVVDGKSAKRIVCYRAVAVGVVNVLCL